MQCVDILGTSKQTNKQTNRQTDRLLLSVVKDGSINYWDLLWISCICDYIFWMVTYKLMKLCNNVVL